MKKLLLAFFAVLLIAGQALAASPGYRQNPGVGDILGQKKYQSDAHRMFRMVRYVQPSSGFATASALPTNSIVVWDVTNDDGVTVTTSTTSSDASVAGITVTASLTQDTQNNTAAQDIGQDNWTWLQTYGYTTVNFAASTGVVDVAGSQFGTSATAGEAAMCVYNSAAASKNGCAGIAYDTAVAGDDSVEVFIKGLD